MDTEKFGKLIKDIRRKNHLTQSEFAKKYGVTYQAVSKWENGKNMPDTFLIQQISKDFQVDIASMLNGEYKTKKKNPLWVWIIGILLVFLVLFLVIFLFNRNHNSSFEFKTLSTTCNDFKISGSIAYNQKKSSIYIANINYCGGEDQEKYKDIQCALYETHQNTTIEISNCNYTQTESMTLEEYLKNINIMVDNYEKTCHEYSDNSLFLEINATDEENKVITYKVPLTLENSCSLK